jgi:hypothetical protein
MKTYTTTITNLAAIRELFDGYVFRRNEKGIGYIKVCENDRKRIERAGIELTETKTED